MNGLAPTVSSPHPLRAPQHLQALARANAVRLARATFKKQIAAGRLDAGALFLDPPPEAETMSVAEVLMSQRRWGTTRCRKFLLPLRISENKPVGSLTERQRRALNDRLAGRTAELAVV